MPVYQCVAARGTLNDRQRQELALDITDIHVSVTGAPAFFVNVVFVDLAEGRVFTGGKPSGVTIINGVIRAGRSARDREQILTRLNAAFCRVAGSAPHEVLIGLTDIDPSSAMEAGLLFPEPGGEAAWIEENKDALAALAEQHAESSATR
ncbi:MAG: tautomerase family protein [Rhodococcus sp. (in: high G+C Gram-positive bacteria)]